MKKMLHILLFSPFILAVFCPAQELAEEEEESRKVTESASSEKEPTAEELASKAQEVRERQSREGLMRMLALSSEDIICKVWKYRDRNRRDWTTSRSTLNKIIANEKSVIDALSEYIRTLLVKNYPDLELNQEEVPDWIVAAFTFQTISQRFGIGGLPGRNDYRSIRLAFHRRIYPEVNRICSNSISTKEYYSYLLYGQHCSLLLEVYVSASRKNALGKWLELNKAGKKPVEIFKKLLEDQLAEGDTVQDWYLRRAPKLAMRRFGPLSLDVVKKRIEELKFVTVPEMKAAGKISLRKIPLHSTVGKFRNNQQRREVATNQQMAIIKLLQETPLVLQEAVALYSEAYNSLIKDDVDEFKEKYLHAQQTLNSEAENYLKVQKFMDEMEVKFTPWQVYLAPYLEVTLVTKPLDDDEIKQKKYLDKVEELLR